MAIKKVDSSMVWAVDYDAKAQVLEIAYRRTGVYRYSGVPPEEYKPVKVNAPRAFALS